MPGMSRGELQEMCLRRKDCQIAIAIESQLLITNQSCRWDSGQILFLALNPGSLYRPRPNSGY